MYKKIKRHISVGKRNQTKLTWLKVLGSPISTQTSMEAYLFINLQSLGHDFNMLIWRIIDFCFAKIKELKIDIDTYVGNNYNNYTLSIIDIGAS